LKNCTRATADADHRSNGMIAALVEIFSGFAEAADRGRIDDLLSRA
jgi:hypothetical protein